MKLLIALVVPILLAAQNIQQAMNVDPQLSKIITSFQEKTNAKQCHFLHARFLKITKSLGVDEKRTSFPTHYPSTTSHP